MGGGVVRIKVIANFNKVARGRDGERVVYKKGTLVKNLKSFEQS